MPSKYTFQPDYAVPPGATLKEVLETKGITQAELAVRTGITEKTISQIVNGAAPITYETASKLELALGISARFWNKRELSYREALVRMEESKRLEAASEWLALLPMKVLIEREYINTIGDKAALVRSALSFFGVSSIAAWHNRWGNPWGVAYRGGEAQERKPGFVAAWLRMGELAAENIATSPYDAKAFEKHLNEIRPLSRESASVWQKELVRLCSEAGVAVVFTQEIPGACVSGATRWLTKDKAILQLSLKYKSDDQLWFTFYHEAAHILLHSKKSLFIEDGEQSSSEEKEADIFARDTLIPPRYASQLYALRGKLAIKNFALTIGVAPGVVVGRLQHDEVLDRKFCNDLKKKLEWVTKK